MGKMWWIIGGLLVVFILVLAPGNIAGESDDQLDEMWRRRQAERDE